MGCAPGSSPGFATRAPSPVAWPTQLTPAGGPVRLAIIGQQAFGKSVLEAFIARSATVAGVFCAPEKPGARPDPLRVASEERGIEVFQLPSLKDEQAARILTGLKVDLGVMAFVVQHVPQAFVNIPKH